MDLVTAWRSKLLKELLHGVTLSAVGVLWRANEVEGPLLLQNCLLRIGVFRLRALNTGALRST